VRAWKYHLARLALSGLGWVTVVKGTTTIAALGKNLFLAGSMKGTNGHSSSPSCATALASPEQSGSRWTSTRRTSSAAPPSARVSIGPTRRGYALREWALDSWGCSALPTRDGAMLRPTVVRPIVVQFPLWRLDGISYEGSAVLPRFSLLSSVAQNDSPTFSPISWPAVRVMTNGGQRLKRRKGGCPLTSSERDASQSELQRCSRLYQLVGMTTKRGVFPSPVPGVFARVVGSPERPSPKRSRPGAVPSGVVATGRRLS